MYLLNQYYPISKRILKRYNIPDEDCWDIFQETICKILYHRRRKAIETEKNYLITAIKNIAKNYIRDKAKYDELFVHDVDISSIPDEEADPEHILMMQQAIQAFISDISTVKNPLHRKILEAYYLEHYDINEIAKLYQVRRNHVSVIITRFNTQFQEKYNVGI